MNREKDGPAIAELRKRAEDPHQCCINYRH